MSFNQLKDLLLLIVILYSINTINAQTKNIDQELLLGSWIFIEYNSDSNCVHRKLDTLDRLIFNKDFSYSIIKNNITLHGEFIIEGNKIVINNKKRNQEEFVSKTQFTIFSQTRKRLTVKLSYPCGDSYVIFKKE